MNTGKYWGEKTRLLVTESQSETGSFMFLLKISFKTPFTFFLWRLLTKSISLENKPDQSFDFVKVTRVLIVTSRLTGRFALLCLVHTRFITCHWANKLPSSRHPRCTQKKGNHSTSATHQAFTSDWIPICLRNIDNNIQEYLTFSTDWWTKCCMRDYSELQRGEEWPRRPHRTTGNTNPAPRSILHILLV